MIMFDFFDADYSDSVILPDNTIYLVFVHSDQLDKNILYIKCCKQSKESFTFCSRRYRLVPALENYKALPYKKESYFKKYDRTFFRLTTRGSGFPRFNSYKSLSKIKGFYSNYKKCYVVIAHRPTSVDDGIGDMVLFVCDRYSDALPLARNYQYGDVSRLLGSDFKPYNGYHPYLWVEYMNHPISLFAEIGTYTGSYELAPAWCYYLCCFLKDGFIKDVYFSSVFGSVHKDKFRQTIHWNTHS